MCSNRKTIQNEAYGEKRMIKKWKSTTELYNNYEWLHIWAIGILGSVGDRKNILRSWKKFSNISEKYKFTGPKTQWIPNINMKKIIVRHIIMKLLKTNDKEKILKGNRSVIHSRMKIMTPLPETMLWKRAETFKVCVCMCVSRSVVSGYLQP